MSAPPTRINLRASRAAFGAGGFALLEAIVAIAVLALALVPIYGLISTGLDGAHRLSRAGLSADLELSALDVMRNINPTMQIEGRLEITPYWVIWHAVPLTDETDSIKFPRGFGLYAMRLYTTHVQVADQNGQAITEFDLLQVGSRRARDPIIPFSAPTQR